MSATTLLIIATIIGLLLLILGLAISIISKKKSKTKTKQISDEQILKDKQFFKKFGPIKFKNWYKYESGIVISSGIKKQNYINNKFVIKNLKKKNSKKIKKIDYQKLSVCVSNKKSSICIAPPGSGKTQALLLPTILFMINCKEKPNLIITDPKPEINQLINDELIKNNYEIINLSTKRIINSDNEFETDFWNIFEEIIEIHKKLMKEKNDLYAVQNYVSEIKDELDKMVSYFKTDENKDFWKDNGLMIIKFLVFFVLHKIETGDWDYKYLNFFNLKNNLNITTTDDLRKMFKELLNKKSISSEMGFGYLAWVKERDENVSSFLTNTLDFLNTFNNSYIAMLTSKTTFNLDQIIQSNKPFVIFLTINTSSIAHISEKSLLKIYLSMINSKIFYYKNKNSNFKNRSVWWLLDEIGNIPKLEFLKTIITYGRGDNQFAFPIFQSEDQMKEIYRNELIASCENIILFNHHNIELAKTISILSGKYSEQLEDGKINTKFNLEIENICNIPNGYLGLFTYKRETDEKSFYIAPVTYFYMLKNIVINSKLKSNEQYLLSEYKKDIYENYSKRENDNNENNIKEINAQKTKNFRYWYLNIDENLILSSPDKSKCMQLLNQITINLEWFRFNKEINSKKFEKINESFCLLKRILNDELLNSLVAKFIWFGKYNKNIIYGKKLSEMECENEQDKTKEN